MIEFNCPNRKYDGTPVVCDLEVISRGMIIRTYSNNW